MFKLVDEVSVNAFLRESVTISPAVCLQKTRTRSRRALFACSCALCVSGVWIRGWKRDNAGQQRKLTVKPNHLQNHHQVLIRPESKPVLSIVAVAPCWRHTSRVPKGASGLWVQCVRTGFPFVVLLLWRCSQVHHRQLELGCSMT